MRTKAPTSYEERTAKRAERRLRQREQNAVRAVKMHCLRIANSTQSASKIIQASLPVFNVGCSGWFYWHWGKSFYKNVPQTRDWFRHYASNFRTVELNAPFYSWPTATAIGNWVHDAKRRRFIYTIKVCELITHVKRFVGTKTLIEDFYYVAHILGPLMGCFLFQLPPSFHYTKVRLRRIVSQLNPAFRNVVEFRHASWWNKSVYSAFRRSGIIFCSSSGPRLPDELIVTAGEIYIRFHGKRKWYRHNYSKDELKIWVERVRKSEADRVWAYFNNDRETYSIKNARMFLRFLKSHARLSKTSQHLT